MNMICREPGELKSKGILWAHLKSKSPQYLRLDNLSNNIYRFNIWRQMNKKIMIQLFCHISNHDAFKYFLYVP